MAGLRTIYHLKETGIVPRDEMSCKILFFASNPKSTQPLKLDEEVRGIDEKIQAAEFRQAFELMTALATRPDDIVQKLLQHKPEIVHFSGHGSESGQLILQDDSGRPMFLTGDVLGSLFEVLKDKVRLVVFNACFTRSLAEAVAAKVGCAVGTTRAIGDDEAIRFAATFYQALAFQRSVRTAFDLANVALRFERNPGAISDEAFLGPTGRDLGRKNVIEVALIELIVGAGFDASRIVFGGSPCDPAVPRAVIDRIQLVVDLSGLDAGSFGLVVVMIPGAPRVVNYLLPVPQQAAMLIAWADSQQGPGLDVVAQALSALP